MNRRLIAFAVGIISFIAAVALLTNITDLPSIIGFQLMGTRLVIIVENPTLCNFTMEQGWNLVSFPCLSQDLDTASFLQPINGSYRAVWHYDPSSSDPWKAFNPDLPSWVDQDLDEVSRRYGYWILLENQTLFYINNSLATPTLTTLQPGWNLLGYPSTQVRNVSDTFMGLEPDFDYVYLFNASEPDWKQYTWNVSLVSDQDLNMTVPNYGYWIYMLDTGTWTID